MRHRVAMCCGVTGFTGLDNRPARSPAADFKTELGNLDNALRQLGHALESLDNGLQLLNAEDQTMARNEQRCAEPQPYYRTAQNAVPLDEPIPSQVPQTQEEALAIADELRQLVASLDASLTLHELNQSERHILARGEMLGQFAKLIRGRIEAERPGGGSRAGRQNA